MEPEALAGTAKGRLLSAASNGANADLDGGRASGRPAYEGAAPIRHIACDTVSSTNSEALARARAGEPGPFWITARAQSAGRGRRGRVWTSPPGNLYATLLLHHPASAAVAAQLSFVTGLAVCDAILSLANAEPPALALKWPNDVFLRAAKVAGILIEGEGTPLAVAIGVGINCTNHPSDTDYPATDLRVQGIDAPPQTLLPTLSSAMARRLAQWNRGTQFASIRADWLALAHPAGSELRVRLAERELRGRFESLDDSGRLLLRLPDGSVEMITAGDVFAIGGPTRPAPTI
jgi:BirA family transcriptional regulator, biotin operon repressor / biotin---[acetyl-CoA-carboxylase] ligase